MKICSLTSGSNGNCIYVESNKSKVLVDCGNTGKLTCELLSRIGVNPGDLNAIFVTHEHLDHIKGVGIMSRKYDLPIIANEKTWIAMKDTIGKIDPKNIFIFKSNTFFSFRDMDIQAISTFHDAVDPVFYIFHQNKQKITILTDTGTVTDSMIESIKGSGAYLIEANHDVEMLKNGPYPFLLKKRILSDYGHLSNDLSSDILSRIVRGRSEIILLGHLSRENNTEELAFREADSKLRALGLDIGKDVRLGIAHKDRVSGLIDIGGN
ncbi:MBL fold metallo-hydrolase [Peptoniphilaceae bacterium SGI.131]